MGELPVEALRQGTLFPGPEGQAHVPELYRHATYPAHYKSLPVLYAADRAETGVPLGTWGSRKLRKQGLLPGILDSLPHRQAPRHLVYAYGPMSAAYESRGASFENQLCLLQLIGLDELQLLNQPRDVVLSMVSSGWKPTPAATFQVLPRRVQMHVTAASLLTATLMHCPSDRIVESRVPLTSVNVDESPAGRRGGYALVTRPAVPVRSLATNIPLVLPIDCSELEAGDKVFVRDLRLDDGQHIVGLRPDLCILKMEGAKTAGG